MVAFLPDSHPPSNRENKDRPNDDAAEGPRSAGRVGDGKPTASVRDTVNVFSPLKMCRIYKHWDIGRN